MKARFLHDYEVATLYEQVPYNLIYYREGAFDYISSDPNLWFEVDSEVNLEKLEDLSPGSSTGDEVDNCLLISNALGSLTPVLARDERLWALLTHTYALNYTRRRWPIPEDDARAVKHVRTHFFARGNRGIERDNAVSRLWWMSFLCSKVGDLPRLEVLRVFLEQSDVRANIVERPTTSQSRQIFTAIIEELHASANGDGRLLQRRVFRPVMEALNLYGGYVLLDLLEKDEIRAFIRQSAEEVPIDQ